MEQGGFALSLSVPSFPGTPDLFVVVPGFVPTMLEAKRQLFPTRQIKATAIQRKILTRINNACSNTAFVVVFYESDDSEWATLVKPHTLYLKDEKEALPVRITDKFIDVKSLFTANGVARCTDAKHSALLTVS